MMRTQTAITKKDFKMTGAIFVGFMVIFMVGYFLLSSAFGFPDILREEASIRFTLFDENRALIVPGYYILCITAVIQIFLAVLWYHITRTDKLSDLFTLVAGITCGIFQILGFYRWIAYVPMLSDTYKAGEMSDETIFFFEKFGNTYLGMTVGEHLGNFFLALWLIGIAVTLKQVKFVGKPLKIMTLVSGLMMFLLSYESLGGGFAVLEVITLPAWGLYYTWILMIGISLLYTKDRESLPRIPIGYWVFGIVFYLGNVIPAFI